MPAMLATGNTVAQSQGAQGMRKNFTAAAVVAVALLAAGMAASRPASASAALPGAVRAAVTVDETVSYGSDPMQTLDAYIDEAKVGAPWVMVVHGGSWMGGSRTLMGDAVNGLRAAGFQVFSVDYRLSGKVGWPAQRDDVGAALRFVKANAAQFGIDPDRGALYGHSAGGQIAASAGVYGAGSTRTRAVVSVSGVLQPLRVWQYAHDVETPDGYAVSNTIRYLSDWEAVLFRGPPRPDFPDVYGRWRDGTPQTMVSDDDAPFLIVHSEDDVASPFAGAAGFAYYLNKAGGSATVVPVPGDVHSDSIVWDNPAMAKRVTDFLKAKTQ